LFIALPRIYLGLHYPTDIICGALIGILFGWAGNRDMVTNAISKPILHWTYAKPDLFYALFFFITYQMADMFDSSRAIIHACVELIINLSST
jgi:undecaprenyl-diphosphatase